MKKYTIGIIALLALAFAATAADYSVTTLTNGLKVAGSSTVTMTTTAPVITLTKYEDVAINVRVTLDSTGTGTQTYTWYKSLDGSTYDTVASYTLAVTPGGTGGTFVQVSTNINMGAVGYIRLGSVQNAQSGQYATNNISYSLKKRRNG
jgi:hypothetical protein